MTESLTLQTAEDALDKCDTVLEKLEATCCRPVRSPRMASLAETLNGARLSLSDVVDDATATATLDLLEDAGAQIGDLQVGCCTLKRMPLYAEMLTELTRAQITVTKTQKSDQ